MKELPIEEKAKRYDEAIERANSLLSGNQLGNAWIYKLLPELKESEDERIRKGLIKAVSVTLKGNKLLGTDVIREEALDWLRKQKPDPRQEYFDALLYADDIYQMAVNDKMVAKAESKAVEALKKIGVTKLLLEKQKSVEWSEEDERMFSFIQKKLTSEVDDWLESLKQRMEEQQ